MNFDYQLLAKYLIGNLTVEEMEEISRWRSLSVENEHVFSDLVRLRILDNYQKYNTTQFVDEALLKLNNRINRKQKRLFLSIVLKYAAMILLFLSVSYGGYEYIKPEKQVSILVKPGEKVKKLVLRDGTVVWLRESSCLTYSESFGIKDRKVSLQGEAFFTVAKNAISFYISTDYLNVEVKGTAFDVKINDRDKQVETTLVSGNIALLDQDMHPVMNMLPGEKVTYHQKNNQYITEQVDPNLCATWRLDQFVFENATLRDIANQLSTQFNVNVNIESSLLAQQKFRCVFNKEESLQDILNLLKYVAPICFRIEDEEVFIWSCKTKKR